MSSVMCPIINAKCKELLCVLYNAGKCTCKMREAVDAHISIGEFVWQYGTALEKAQKLNMSIWDEHRKSNKLLKDIGNSLQEIAKALGDISNK